MTNLLEETIIDIERSGHAVEDVTFIGSHDAEYRCTWDEFKVLADREYNPSYGTSEIATDLIILFSDGRKMWRGEYDGSEWWEFDAHGDVDYTQPGKPIERLHGSYAGALARLQDPKNVFERDGIMTPR